MSDKNHHIHTHDFRVSPGDKVDLEKHPTRVKPVYDSKDEYMAILTEHVKGLSERQELLYADDSYALLLIFQAMDAAGKDGTIAHVMSGVNPQGCQVYSFKQPSTMELDHDFLWRVYQCLPERGRIGIFNRSYYEEVLVVKVHPELLNYQKLPEEIRDDKEIWDERYRSIVDMERHLYRNGTRIVKFYLHVSADEQKRRFIDRIDDKSKHWKFSASDVKERGFWKDYMAAFGECLSRTSTEFAPWYIVPADDKDNMRLIVSQIIFNTLDDLKMEYPVSTPEREAELEAAKKQLLAE
jgi:PPK2 family polyphosphate:nucleotide phosphotransferase